MLQMPVRAVREAVESALATNDLARAVELAETALAHGEVDPLLLNLAGWKRMEGGDFTGAHELLERALALAPGDPGILAAIGTTLRREGRLGEAVRTLDAAIARAPGYPTAWLERAFTLHEGGSLRLASESYARAAELDPGASAAFAGLASIAASQGEGARARQFAVKALAIDRNDAVATAALARSELADGDAETARDRLRDLLTRSEISDEDRMTALTLLGDAHDKLGAHGFAFIAYIAAKAVFAGRFAPPRGQEGETHRMFIERIDRAMLAHDREDFRPAATASAPAAPRPAGHAFLIGYPRSGTTLVETILASANGVEALEERPTLRAADAAFLLPRDGIDRLVALDAAEADRYRAAYWQYVAESGISPGARLFVDMDPLKGLKLPLIARLFPQARVVVMRRDPRDVVWSCFRQNFAPTAAAMEFIGLDRAARHYDAMMRLQQRCLDTLEITALPLHYEALTSDFDTETRRLCDFLGLDWTPALRDFSATARARDVATASVAQVRRGLFNGAGQWRNYAPQLEPVMPLLAPWIERFGYAG